MLSHDEIPSQLHYEEEGVERVLCPLCNHRNANTEPYENETRYSSDKTKRYVEWYCMECEGYWIETWKFKTWEEGQLDEETED